MAEATRRDPVGALHTEDYVRVPPHATARSRFFWQSGAEGVLRLLQCRQCGRYQHPPLPVCPSCRSMSLTPEPVSGRGSVYSYTVNRYQWLPGMPPPYVIATVELVEQAGLQLLTNVVDCSVESVHIGMEVEAAFIAGEDIYLPVFRPVRGR